MRTLLGVALAVLLTGGASQAEDKKVDAKKLLGKWETKPDAAEKFQVEFLKDGKLTLTAGEMKIPGTYKLDGNKITVVIKIGDDEKKMTRTISKLTDTEITSKDDESGKEDTLVRVKEKKDK